MSITKILAEDRQKNSVVILEHKPSYETGDYLVKSFIADFCVGRLWKQRRDKYKQN